MAAIGAVNAEVSPVADTPNEFQLLESLKVNKTLQAIEGHRVRQYKQSPKYIFRLFDENSLRENLQSNVDNSEDGADSLMYDDNRDSPPTSITVSKKQGSGGFGYVFKGTMKGRDICLKVSKSSRRDTEKYLIREARNFRLLKDPNHENIIRFHFVCYIMDCKRACIVMDYFPGGDLERLVREYQQEGMRPHKTRINKIIRGIVSAVSHMQTLSMIHCDIKPGNVLYNCYSMEVKVIDFGCAVVYGGADKPRSRDFGGTPIYMAPEMLEEPKRPYLDSTDVYSIGALIFKLLTLRNPWYDDFNIYEARKEKGGHRHRLIKQALWSAMADRAEVCDEGVRKEYTKLQVTLLNNLADHRRIYLKQCNLACDMLNYHPIDRPRCDVILAELDAIMDEGLYDPAHRNDHRENIVAQLSHMFGAANLDSAEAVPSFLAQFDNSTCSGSTYKGTEVPSAMLSEDRRLLAEHRDPRGGTGITTHTCSTDPSQNSTGCRQSDSDSDHGGVGSALQTADGYVQFTNHGDDRVQVWPIRSEASDNDQLEWSDIESFKDATVGLEDTTGFSTNHVESHDIENTSVSVDTVMEAWTLDNTMVDSQAGARKRRYLSGMTMSSFDESAIPDDSVLELLQTESEQR